MQYTGHQQASASIAWAPVVLHVPGPKAKAQSETGNSHSGGNKGEAGRHGSQGGGGGGEGVSSSACHGYTKLLFATVVIVLKVTVKPGSSIWGPGGVMVALPCQQQAMHGPKVGKEGGGRGNYGPTWGSVTGSLVMPPAREIRFCLNLSLSLGNWWLSTGKLLHLRPCRSNTSMLTLPQNMRRQAVLLTVLNMVIWDAAINAALPQENALLCKNRLLSRK